MHSIHRAWHQHRDRAAHGPFGRERGRHGGPRARLFDHGDLRVAILGLIAEQPRHGYEIIRVMEERTGGGYAPSPGVVYPTLTMLEELGQASVSEADGRKLYAITEAGRAALAGSAEEHEALRGRMAEVRSRYEAAEAPQIVRAMENLKLALRLRLARQPLGAAEREALAALLDAAARDVERS